TDVMSPYPIVGKLEAFGFFVQEIDGHDFDALEEAFNKAKTVKGMPSAIVIKTTKGKGVSYMENNAGWHGKAPNDEEYEQAMNELKAQLAELEA
ncbi:MAG: transketolase, partial [Oscillospiraceae bacterium]|nr:transketolase [Oscillospiraceae bacterium]